MAVRVSSTWRIVDRLDALSAGVDPSRLRKEPHLIKDAAALQGASAWAERSVGDGWIAAYRVTSDRGRPVVAEVRIFPDRWGQGERPSGTWSGDYLDVPPVPAGGLRATLLRRVKLVDAFHDVVDYLTRLSRVEKEDAHGITKELSLPSLESQPIGPKRIDDLALARLANLYVKGKCEVRRVAQQAHLSTSTLRGRIHLARQRGILESGVRGVASTRLTAHGREILKAAGRRRSNERSPGAR